MVYRGKPSKACLPCRKRKLICDLKEQGCSSCRRAKLICHGYRDTEALRVADESSAVQRKIHNLSSKSDPKSHSLTSQLSEARTHIFNLTETIPQSMVIPTLNQATDLFYYNYVFGAFKPFEFLRTFYSSMPMDDHLTASMDAVALAYLDYQHHTPNAQIEARQHYVTALRLMNKAIQDPQLAMKDSTILAILLLDLYEKVATKESHYEGSWAAHLQGALTLAKMRGDEQFNDPIVLRILLRMCTNQIISCIATHRPVPEDVVTMRENISGRIGNYSGSKVKESDLMTEFARLKYQIENGILLESEAVRSLSTLDDRFRTLCRDVRSTWQFKAVLVSEKSSHHWESHHHIYPCQEIGQVWNVLRVTRILLNELLLDISSNIKNMKSPYATIDVQKHATEVIIDMISDICASVPQFIGDPSVDSQQSLSWPVTTHSLEPGASKKQQRLPLAAPMITSNPTNYLPCYRLLFPLYVATQSQYAPEGLKPWVIHQLFFMADHHGIENAARIMDILESGEKRDPWHVYAMLGSYAFVC